MSRIRNLVQPIRRRISTVTVTSTETATTLLEQDAVASSSSSSLQQEPMATTSNAEPLSGVEELLEFRRRREAIKEQFGRLGSTQNRENTFQPHHPIHRPVNPNSLTLSALLAAGAHLGHASSLLRPAFLPYAYGTRAGITIIDLDQTLPLLRRAANVTREVARKAGSILFVGTHESLRPAVIKAAQRMESNGYQLSTRWKPGSLTNSKQVFGEDVIQHLNHIPDLVILLNPLDNMALIKECNAVHIPTIGIIDSNVDPRIVTYPIPASDDSVRTAELIAGMLSIAGKEGIELKRADRKADRERVKASAVPSGRLSSLVTPRSKTRQRYFQPV
ncbi:37S ribosomal protein, mitochondrial [Tulasnella sp. 403]|nr:37S ribosomal protein, mitochondrial [Tulasnella sp. 403]